MQSVESKDESIQRYVDISYLPTEHHGPVMDLSKDFQFDFMCTDASGTVFIVEMQRYHEDYWFKRCVSYAIRTWIYGESAIFLNTHSGKKRRTTCWMRQ